MTATRITVATLLLLLLCAVAEARQRSDGSLSEFQKHYERGITLYKSGQYAAAIPELSAAYDIKQLPRLLYNLGQAHRRLGHSREAVRYYELYLQVDTDIRPKERARVEQLLETTRAMIMNPEQMAEEQPKHEETPPVQPPAPPVLQPLPPPVEHPGLPLWSRASIGVSGGLLAVALITGISALAEDAALRNTVYPTSAAFASQQGTVRGLALGTDVIGGIGLAALATTLIVTYVRKHPAGQRDHAQ